MGLLTKILGGGAAEVAGTVVKGVGNIMDRFGFTKKMSEKEKFDNYFKMVELENTGEQINQDGIKSAREMYMVEMSNQKQSWLVRQLNGALRPTAGWWALICMTDKVWSQVLGNLIPNFAWEPVMLTPIEQSILAGILAFFFGMRQRSKEKNVATIS